MATEREQKAKDLAIDIAVAAMELIEARLDSARAQSRVARAEVAHSAAIEELRVFAASTPAQEPTR